MKKYKKIIIVVLCFALLLSMFSISAFAVDETTAASSDIMPLDDEGYFYYVPAGWHFADFEFSGTFILSSFNYPMVSFSDFSIADDVFEFQSNSLLPSDDFLLISFIPIPAFSDYSLPLDITNSTFFISSGWTIPANFDDSESPSDLIINDVSYYVNYYIGATTTSGDDLSYVDNSLVFAPVGGEPIVLTSSDSFTISGNFGSIPLFYFVLHNGEVLSPPTVLDSILEAFLSVGSWISGATSSLIPMFWNSADGTLTFVGLLSVSSLALSVVFLVLSLIEKFLRFGG